ncbi:MAG: RnfABCDGE type electron transport complex subunit D, partial [Rikenellaceae bacterium]
MSLRNFINNIKPAFEKGGRFQALHSTFDAFESFLFVPNTVTKNGSHIRDVIDMKRTMFIVVVALVPALLFGMYNAGLQHFRAMNDLAAASAVMDCFWFGFLKVLPIIIVSYVVGLGIEFIVAQMRHHEVNEGFLVSGMLIPLVMPIDAPLWMVAVATAFAVIIGKEVFGGTGMNVFNPALLARAFMFFAYTPYISGEKIWIAGMNEGLTVDGYSGATPLTEAANALAEKADTLVFSSSPIDWFIGTIPGSIGETSVIAILIGAAILLFTGIASWRIMFSVFVGGYLMGTINNLVGANPFMNIPSK